MPRPSPRSRKPAPAPTLAPADPERLRVLVLDTQRIVAQGVTFADEVAFAASSVEVLLVKYAGVPTDVEDTAERGIYDDARALAMAATAAVSYVGAARVALVEAVEAARAARPGACEAVEAARARASHNAMQAGLVAAHAGERFRRLQESVALSVAFSPPPADA